MKFNIGKIKTNNIYLKLQKDFGWDQICLFKVNLLDVHGKSSGRQRRNVCKWGIYLLRKGTSCLQIRICLLCLLWQLGRQNSVYRTVVNALVLSSSDA